MAAVWRLHSARGRSAANQRRPHHHINGMTQGVRRQLPFLAVLERQPLDLIYRGPIGHKAIDVEHRICSIDPGHYVLEFFCRRTNRRRLTTIYCDHQLFRGWG